MFSISNIKVLNAFKLSVASAAVLSKAVVLLLLLIYCFMYLPIRGYVLVFVCLCIILCPF